MGQYFEGININLILSKSWVPDKETIPKYKNIPNKTEIGIILRAVLANKHKPERKNVDYFKSFKYEQNLFYQLLYEHKCSLVFVL